MPAGIKNFLNFTQISVRLIKHGQKGMEERTVRKIAEAKGVPVND